MKTLNQYIKESLQIYNESLQSKAIYNESILDDEEDIINNLPIEIVKDFILNNYDVKESYLKIMHSNGKYIVNCNSGVVVRNKKITQLTNDLFEWGEIKGSFYCSFSNLKSLQGAPKEVGGGFYCDNCDSLKSLQGAPEKVEGCFYCSYCYSLKSLKGAPKKVGGDFCCSHCNSLTSLKGAPKEVGGGFDCYDCISLTTLEGAPKEIGWDFDCNGCNSLTSLQGAPKKVGGNFDCSDCGTQFTKEEVEKVSKVKGNIIA